MMNRRLCLPIFTPGVVLEGGSIDVNGKGTVLTTRSCLLNPNRNPGLSADQIEEKLKEYLGVEKVIWLNDGVVGDDTDGHIDDIARFVSPSTVVCAYEMHQELGEYSERDAAGDYARWLMGLSTDNMLELSYPDRRRVHNLKYFTWVEQQGKTYAEIQSMWNQPDYWTSVQKQAGEIDELIVEFNKEVGIA